VYDNVSFSMELETNGCMPLMFVELRNRAGLKPMQLHWAPRLWGLAPWCLGRLFTADLT